MLLKQKSGGFFSKALYKHLFTSHMLPHWDLWLSEITLALCEFKRGMIEEIKVLFHRHVCHLLSE